MIENAKEELFECLVEECAEVVKAKTKIARFGETPERRQHLLMEMADVMGVMSMIFEEMQLSEAEQNEMYLLGEVSMKKRDGFMKFKPRVRHQ